MSVPRERLQKSFTDVSFMAGELFGERDRYRLMREKILPLLRRVRGRLEQLYDSRQGRPAIEPVVMAGTLLLQFMEKVPDRQAVQQLRLNLGWKYALDLRVDEKAFHPTSLVVFRKRLMEAGAEALVFDEVVKALGEEGLIKKGKRRRLDSTHVVSAVREMSRLDTVRETLRLCLEDLEKESSWKRPAEWEDWIEKYCEQQLRRERWLKKKELIKRLEETGEDADQLLRWLEEQEEELLQRQSVQLLNRVMGEHFEGKRQQRRIREKQAAGAVKNPHDPQAQWGKMRTGSGGWVGYKVQVSESVCEQQQDEPTQKGKPTRQFLTEMTTTEATTSDLEGMRKTLDRERQKGLGRPEQLHVDSGYITGEELERAQRQKRELIGPVRRPPTRRGYYCTTEFAIDYEEMEATCPQGEKSKKARVFFDRSKGKYFYEFRWGAVCGDCRLRAKCTRQSAKILRLTSQHQLLDKRRCQMQDPEFRKQLLHRNGIEGTISELVRSYGLRKSRYRGQGKTRLANYWIGAACNVNRWLRLLAWTPNEA